MGVYANKEPYIEECLFSLYPVVLIASALFTSIFIGTEQSHKAIRSKLIIGHKRISVYLSELITAVTIVTAALLLYAPANNYSAQTTGEKLMNVIPSTHLKRLAQADPRYDKELEGLSEMPVCSAGVIAVSTAIGAAIFSKKNLR